MQKGDFLANFNPSLADFNPSKIQNDKAYKYSLYVPFKLGFVLLKSDGKALCELKFTLFSGKNAPCELLNFAKSELKAYFRGEIFAFKTPLKNYGTAFESAVYSALRAIPYGETASYKQIASVIGRANAQRAVGRANAKNKIPIFIPCHRVVAAKGLGGYSGAFADEVFKNNDFVNEALKKGDFVGETLKKSDFANKAFKNVTSKATNLDIKRFLLKLEGVDLSKFA